MPRLGVWLLLLLLCDSAIADVGESMQSRQSAPLLAKNSEAEVRDMMGDILCI
jgi:hypothetical protein